MAFIDTVKGFFKLDTKESKPGTHNTSYPGVGSKGYIRVLEYQGKRITYKKARKITEDTQVKVGLDILNYFLLSKNYVITSASDEPEDLEIKEFVEDVLDNMETPFREVDKNMNTAIKYGFSANEIVYTLNKDTKIVFKGIYPIHMRTLQNEPFTYNDKGVLIEIHQESDYGDSNIPIDKILLYSFDSEFDEVEGRSILTEIADFTNDKKEILNWLLTFLHKHENPTIYAKVSNGNIAKKIRNALDAIAGGKTNITVGKDDDLGVLESSHRGETFFKALTLIDNYIFRRFYLGNLLLGDPSQTGSYSQSDVQFRMSMNILNGIQEDKASVWQKKINELVAFNFGPNANVPKFSYESFIEKDYLNLLNALKDLVSDGVIDSSAPWWKELIATTVQKESGVKVDTDTVDDVTLNDNDADYGYQPPLPGDAEADMILKGLI